MMTVLPILFRDEWLCAVDKPSGLAVHRGWARERDTAMTLLRDQLGQWVYPPHRLDRGTSGCLVFALNPEAARALGEQFERGEVFKRYLALTRGEWRDPVLLDHPVRADRKGVRVPAATAFRPLARGGGFTLTEAIPRTGRLHQIRQHLKHLGHPIVGDVEYGKGDINRRFRAEFGFHRLALHAAELRLKHPVTGAGFIFRAPLPAPFLQVLMALGIPYSSAEDDGRDP
ncbi:MAG: tRNA pseudouridine synthase C [Myxococcota bacterium]|nr:tRNA pseudouridine synthase C [Myxococcota bacterium]